MTNRLRDFFARLFWHARFRTKHQPMPELTEKQIRDRLAEIEWQLWLDKDFYDAKTDDRLCGEYLQLWRELNDRRRTTTRSSCRE